MIVALDTNVLLREADSPDLQHAVVRARRRELLLADHTLVTAPQCLYEFWIVATRPAAQNGFGLSPADAYARVQEIRTAYPVLADPRDLVDRWLQLCLTHASAGRPAHDARIVAWMDAYGIQQLLTLNPAGFRRYSHITLIIPGEAA